MSSAPVSHEPSSVSADPSRRHTRTSLSASAVTTTVTPCVAAVAVTVGAVGAVHDTLNVSVSDACAPPVCVTVTVAVSDSPDTHRVSPDVSPAGIVMVCAEPDKVPESYRTTSPVPVTTTRYSV